MGATDAARVSIVVCEPHCKKLPFRRLAPLFQFKTGGFVDPLPVGPVAPNGPVGPVPPPPPPPLPPVGPVGPVPLKVVGSVKPTRHCGVLTQCSARHGISRCQFDIIGFADCHALRGSGTKGRHYFLNVRSLTRASTLDSQRLDEFDSQILT